VTLASFLDRLASGESAPGGGAAAALAGAAAAALVAMACRVTARRAPSEALAAAVDAADELRHRLLTLMHDDVEAYASVLESRRAPSERRAPLVEAAMRRATTVPLHTARAAAGVLELSATILDAVRTSVVGDLGVAVALAGAALDASALTARINLQEIAEDDFARAARDTLERLAAGADARRALAQRVAARVGAAGHDAGRPA
jgi:formiminotetrahydrofolate cyclodeaminase